MIVILIVLIITSVTESYNFYIGRKYLIDNRSRFIISHHNRRLTLHSTASDTSLIQKKVCLYNSLSRRKEPFISLNPNKVSFYSCGPTVYDFAHVGNFRAFLTYDLLKRWLSYCGYDVDHVCNLTDVDDKIIVKMAAERKSLTEITEFYTKLFFEDLDTLNIIRARAYPKATEHMKDIEEMIESLISKDHAYVEGGSVYFRVSSFKNYGELANLKLDKKDDKSRSLQDGAGGSGPNERRGSDEKESS